MGMMTLVVKGCIPAEIFTVNPHVLAEHGPLGTKQSHPLLCAVIAKPRRILPPQGNHMGPYSAFVFCHLTLHLCQYH